MSSRSASRRKPEGWHGWDEYAPFYDWENARTVGRADVPFWKRVAARVRGPVLELGCGTGRITLPLARAGVSIVGVDRSGPMLERAARRARTLKTRRGGTRPGALSLVRGDIRTLPFAGGQFSLVLAPYGILQSLIRDRDLKATLDAVARVVAPGGTFGIDLVPDVPNWREYQNRIQLRGRAAGGAHLTLVESVRQDPRGHLTTFEQRYVRRVGRTVTERTFELTFRTLPVKKMIGRLERAGFKVDRVLGDYRGRPWDERAEVWIILATRQM
ncbi:MAG: class I SAM-dependent methyltransferase [Vicinamibacterales bacterium]